MTLPTSRSPEMQEQVDGEFFHQPVLFGACFRQLSLFSPVFVSPSCFLYDVSGSFGSSGSGSSPTDIVAEPGFGLEFAGGLAGAMGVSEGVGFEGLICCTTAGGVSCFGSNPCSERVPTEFDEGFDSIGNERPEESPSGANPPPAVAGFDCVFICSPCGRLVGALGLGGGSLISVCAVGNGADSNRGAFRSAL